MRIVMAALLAFLSATQLCQASAQATDKPAKTIVHHDIRVTIDPVDNTLDAVDVIASPPPAESGKIEFFLAKGLSPSAGELAATPLDSPANSGNGGIYSGYSATVTDGEVLTLTYAGVVNHQLKAVGKEYARGFMATPGIISTDGVVLSGATHWVPRFGDELLTFDLVVELPPGWDAVSQGELIERVTSDKGTRVHWRSATPQDEIYLIAAPFTYYEQQTDGFTAMAYLRTPDPALAQKFLDATLRYIKMYEGFIGPYPFTKFALVENFWETGYGMPSFTLLGPRIIRFPFILRTSYPHEILHNWWGNSVYVDYSRGNWAEGLTAYLADHLMREQSGAGRDHRESTLQKYLDYVADGNDGPLTGFVSRHSSASEALGYGKSLMVFHMLRKKLGDESFTKGLQQFYLDNRWERASWTDLESAFEKATGEELDGFFTAWVEQTGAPILALKEVRREETPEGWRVSGQLSQTQQSAPYELEVPIAMTVEGSPQALAERVKMTGAQTPFTFSTDSKPLRIDVDPGFDLFRLLDRNETPPALSGSFGADKSVMVLPSGAAPEMIAGYKKLAETWTEGNEGDFTIVEDSELDALPADGGVWLLGWENTFLPKLKEALSIYPAKFGDTETDLGSTTVPREGHSVVATARRDGDPLNQITLVAADTVAPLPGLTRKLPHYHKYSYLGFAGDEPANIAKGRWPAVGSPLTFYFEENAARGTLPQSPPLAQLPPVFSKAKMMEVIEYLASVEREGRSIGSAGLEKSSAFIVEHFRASGLQPGGDEGGWLQSFTAKDEKGEEAPVANVVGIVRGTNPALADQPLVVGAHYDHLGLGYPDVKKGNKGKLHPGADDNASGVAVLLELAKHFGGSPMERPIIFVAFSAEELSRTGSLHYLKASPFPPEKTFAMINIDTVGRLGEGKILVLGAGSAREWVHIFMGAGFVTGAKVESVMKDFGSSDQASFIEAGVPAVQLFTGAHLDYHAPGDTPDKIDGDGLVAVAEVAKEAVEYLGKRADPLSSTLGSSKSGASPKQGSRTQRKVSLGTVPDFSYQEGGVKVAQVVEGSPAQEAGIETDDVITAVDGEEVDDLKAFSDILKKHSSGDTVKVTVKRGGEEITLEAVLTTR